ncbi:MAG: helix-turn-helix transcriptional regulator [Silicimonas sp.]|nr:helix-turn-helix transcriptional regulator [Silicimonas sp.]
MIEQTAVDQETEPRDAYAHVGQEMKRLRLARGLTQAQAAQVISVSPQQYQKYEEAHSKCSLNYLIALAEHYSVDVNTFLPGKAQQPTPSPQSMASEADLLARLVSAFVQLEEPDEKLRLVQLVEAISKRESGRSA